MFKVSLVLAVALVAAVASAQEVAPAQEAAPEPYSYAYQTDTHAASEQRDPSGKVTGFYTLVGDDGRERRVEYIADEAGFRAKIATNEVGTKSESPADVELTASEPTAAQYAAVQYQQAAPAPQVVPQVQYQPPKLVQQTVVARPQVQAIRNQVSYVQQQPAGGYYTTTNGAYGLNRGAYYGNTGYGAGYGSGAYYSYQPGYTYGTTTGYGAGYGTGYATNGLLNVGNYNNHLPSQYYRSVSSSATGGNTVVPAAGYTSNSVRYVTQQPGVATTGYRTIGGAYPAGGSIAYGTTTGYGVPAGVTTSTRTVGASSNLAGSSNYIVLSKREAADDKKKSS